MLETKDDFRFARDFTLMEEIRGDPFVQRELSVLDEHARGEEASIGMLANAVRADPDLVPRLRARVEHAEQLTGGRSVEAYVYNAPTVNALVIDGVSRLIVAVSSSALNLFDDEELDFVIGHELGHTAYGHLDIAVEHLLGRGGLPLAMRMKLRAWQRAAEISADRMGLHCCNSLAVAASALFKTVSGLQSSAEIDPTRFAAQWDDLNREIALSGSRDLWNISHPFPPLRMKAMQLYWNALQGEASTEHVERKVEGLLASMDPMAGEEGALGDTLLAEFFFWGGLYIAFADGVLKDDELAQLAAVAPAGLDVAALATSTTVSDDTCLERFRNAIAQRRRRLSAVELHRIIEGLIGVASADGHIDPAEVARLHELGHALGIPPRACNLLIAKTTGDP